MSQPESAWQVWVSMSVSVFLPSHLSFQISDFCGLPNALPQLVERVWMFSNTIEYNIKRFLWNAEFGHILDSSMPLCFSTLFLEYFSRFSPSRYVSLCGATCYLGTLSPANLAMIRKVIFSTSNRCVLWLLLFQLRFLARLIRLTGVRPRNRRWDAKALRGWPCFGFGFSAWLGTEHPRLTEFTVPIRSLYQSSGLITSNPMILWCKLMQYILYTSFTSLQYITRHYTSMSCTGAAKSFTQPSLSLFALAVCTSCEITWRHDMTWHRTDQNGSERLGSVPYWGRAGPGSCRSLFGSLQFFLLCCYLFFQLSNLLQHRAISKWHLRHVFYRYLQMFLPAFYVICAAPS